MATEWPALVGTDGDKAVATIKKENPELEVIKVNKDDIVTGDYKENRVRVFVDPATNKVARAPRVG